MDKMEWFELVRNAKALDDALLDGNPQTVVDTSMKLIEFINMKAGDTAEYGGWYSELEEYIDSLPLE